MGNLLGSPVTEKETHTGATAQGAQFGVSSMQGWRVHMEDAHIMETPLYAIAHADVTRKIDLPGHALFAVFDGHGGTFAAAYSGRNFCRVLSKQPKFVEYAEFMQERPQKEAALSTEEERASYRLAGFEMLKEGLITAFVDIDREIALALQGKPVPDADQPYFENETPDNCHHQNESMDSANQNDSQQMDDDAPKVGHGLEDEGDSGTTACIVVMTPDWIVCANAGDSRAVYSRSGHQAIPLSEDHKPDDVTEERRIRAAGGYVAGGRVEGDLAVSRGLGDFRFKDMQVVMTANDAPATDLKKGRMMPGDQKVSPIPDVTIYDRLESEDEFVLLACDGIWDVQTNYEAVKCVADLFAEGEGDVGLICEEILDLCLEMGSKDNMTAMVVKLAAQKVGEGGGVMARRQRREAERREAQESKEQVS